MDNKNEKIEIPQIVYEGEDRRLKERVIKFKTGTFRIVAFTIVGLIMGACSRAFESDPVWLTRLITSIPYRISKAIYVSIIGTDAVDSAFRYQFFNMNSLERALYHPVLANDFFPYSEVAAWLAAVATPVLAGGAIYGMLAYLTGDSRVFTFGRFLKFAGCWGALIGLTICAAYGINAKAVSDNEHLRGDISIIFFYRLVEDSGVSGVGREDAQIQEYLYSGLEPAEVERAREEELPLHIYYDDWKRIGLYWINYRRQYLVTEEGIVYHISEEFAQAAQEYAENGDWGGGAQWEE